MYQFNQKENTTEHQGSSTPVTVSKLTYRIKDTLENDFSNLWVQGEISNLKVHSSGHLYFDLKDEEAKIAAVLFRGYRKNLSSLPKDGDLVKVLGSVSIYPPQGKYQLIAQSIEYMRTGDLLLKFEKLKQELLALGWFDRDIKKTLPPFSKTIGVISSPTGAVIQDIVHVLERRCKGFHLLLNPVKVQGEGASNEIAQAIRQMNESKLCDVLIVARGGGSIEDLWPFNEKIVAQAIFESHIPIVSAVGHETDFTIADFVADIRAPTPSAAAELVSYETKHWIENLNTIRKQIYRTLKEQLALRKEKLLRITSDPLISSPYHLIAPFIQKVDHAKERMQDRLTQIKSYTKEQKKHLKNKEQSLLYLMQKKIELERHNLASAIERLHSLDPRNILKRGYSILFAEKKQSIVTSISQLNLKQKVFAQLKDGTSTLTVEEIDHE